MILFLKIAFIVVRY